VLYLDSSALIKHYLAERGTQALNAKLDDEEKNFRSPFTSVLTYAEVHAALARLKKEGQLRPDEAVGIQDRFDSDWVFTISPIDCGPGVLGFVRNIVAEAPLRGADAVHLASALWLRDMARTGVRTGHYTGPLVFASSDQQLLKAAHKHQIEVFNPEKTK
jgi:uncharacterized protein